MINLSVVFLPIFLGIMVFVLKDDKKLNKTVFLILVLTAILVSVNNILFFNKEIVFFKLLMNLEYGLKTDSLAVFFSFIMAFIWLIVGVYSFEYMSHYKNLKRYYAYYLITLGAILGVCYADNLVTLYTFFEVMSLSAYMLVIHDGTSEAHRAGRKFVYYSIFGASLGLIAIIYLYAHAPDTAFSLGGNIKLQNHTSYLFAIFVAVVGFGCKAGLYPLHSWLAQAHPVAPAPASSVLSGVITKSGVIAIIRLMYYFISPSAIKGTWVQYGLIALSLISILLGSMLALRETQIKRRLAYSSISQVSYVLLGLFLFNEIGFIAALLQVVFHALAKNLLFMSAGAFIYTTGHTTTDKLKGMGYALKENFILFTVGAFSLVGIPLTAGFVSKWYLAQGSLMQEPLGLVSVCVIMISAVLTAGYLFSVVVSGFFIPKNEIVNERYKLSKLMLIPMSILAFLIVGFGIYPQIVIDFVSDIALSLNI